MCSLWLGPHVCVVFQEVLKMLRSLAYVLKGGLSGYMDTVIEGIKRCLKDKSQVRW